MLFFFWGVVRLRILEKMFGFFFVFGLDRLDLFLSVADEKQYLFIYWLYLFELNLYHQTKETFQKARSGKWGKCDISSNKFMIIVAI